LIPEEDAGGPGVSSEVTADLTWAAFNLSAARAGLRMVEALALGQTNYERLNNLLQEDWDQLEVAAMSLGFGEVQTALDLCANAAMRLEQQCSGVAPSMRWNQSLYRHRRARVWSRCSG
jgi:hypothetical protein